MDVEASPTRPDAAAAADLNEDDAQPAREIGGRQVHPAADIFPELTGDEMEALAADIQRNGLRLPIVVDREGRVLDGRHRLAACDLTGVKPTFETVDATDPVGLVVSYNVKRRHLTQSLPD
jgi:ParB-like chromosome segregation protein Spo0J